MTGWAQEHVFTFEPTDSVDFMIEGVTEDSVDSVSLRIVDYYYDWNRDFPAKDGHFFIKERLPRHTLVSLGDKQHIKGRIAFAVDEVPIRVNLVDGTVVGSELNNKLNQYEHLQWELDQENLNIGERLTSQQHDSISSVFNHQIAKPEKGVVREAFDQYEEIFEKENEKRRRAVYENLDNMIPALYLFTDYTDFSYEELCELMQEDRPYANHYKMQDAWEYFMNLKLHHNGMTFNDCELVDKEGAVHRLSEYAGKDKYVLIDFWASWCAPCIAGIPKVDEIRQMFEPKGLVVLGISIDEDDGAWKAACDRLDCSWLKFRNYQKDGDLSVCNAFGVRSVPLSVLIAPDGTIVAQGLGDWYWKQKLNEIFDKE